MSVCLSVRVPLCDVYVCLCVYVSVCMSEFVYVIVISIVSVVFMI